MTVLQRLLKNQHSAVFDLSPQSELVLRVRHADGAVWLVEDETLRVKAGAQPAKTYDLKTLTVGQLVTALVADGFDVPQVATAWQSRSAMALVEGTGNQANSNGDRIDGYTSLLWAIMSGYGGEVRAAQLQIAQALRQMVIPQAEGEWLDVWGTLYGVARKQVELDAAYQMQFSREVFRQRTNARAIEIAIKDETGWDVRIEEPWREMFRLDESSLSGGHKFYDGDHVGYHLIRPEALDNVDWAVVLPIIERNKPAGVRVVDYRVKPTHVYQEIITYTSQPWRGTRRSWATAKDNWRGLNPMVDAMHLSLSGARWGAQDVVWGAEDVISGVP